MLLERTRSLMRKKLEEKDLDTYVILVGIKTHLRRHPVAVVTTEPVEEIRPSVLKCKHCGRDIVQVPGRKKSSTAAMNAVTGGGICIWTRSSVRRTPPLFALPAVNGSPFTEMISESTAATIAISSTGLVTAQQ